jgi:CheY-like chemotaxis protein
MNTIIGKALDGGQAVEMAQLLRPDLVLMDIEMPKIDGIEATQRIYADNPVPVVVLTAYETPELVERASTAGVGAYLAKPPKARDLERAITIAMARFADMVELRRLNAELQARNEELQGALAKVKMLSGLLPICASCKKIRDDRGYWQQVEVYIRDHSEVEFSHGLCPDCARELFPDFYTEDE